MSGDLRTDVPRIEQRLAVALRFRDTFTGGVVQAPLSVSIPAQHWDALPIPEDRSYRFLMRDGLALPATFDVTVEAPGGEYVNYEAIHVGLPRVQVPPPPPVLRSTYLVEAPLWPTRLLKIPRGETAVIGLVTSHGANSIAGVKIVIFAPPGPAPASPYTRTDAGGEFLFRLPGLKIQTGGAAPVLTALRTVAMYTPGGQVPVFPNSITVPLGQVSVLRFQIP